MNSLKFFVIVYMLVTHVALIIDAYAFVIILASPIPLLGIIVFSAVSGILWFFELVVDFAVLMKGWQSVFTQKKKEAKP